MLLKLLLMRYWCWYIHPNGFWEVDLKMRNLSLFGLEGCIFSESGWSPIVQALIPQVHNPFWPVRAPPPPVLTHLFWWRCYRTATFTTRHIPKYLPGKKCGLLFVKCFDYKQHVWTATPNQLPGLVPPTVLLPNTFQHWHHWGVGIGQCCQQGVSFI